MKNFPNEATHVSLKYPNIFYKMDGINIYRWSPTYPTWDLSMRVVGDNFSKVMKPIT